MTSRTETHLPEYIIESEDREICEAVRNVYLLAEAARAYCKAMHANKDAEPVDWERARAEVDRTYFEMMKLAGYYEEPVDE